MWSRKPGPPADVKASMTLVRGERVLAAAADSAGDWIIGTARALHLGKDGGWAVLPWQRVERAGWDRDAEQLEVFEVADFGEQQPRHVRTISDPGRLLELVHERVTASVVLTRHQPVAGSKGLRIVGRRAPGTDEPITWSALLDDTLDPADPRVVEALERGLISARAEVSSSTA
jgi:hypothetical protein